MTGILVQGGYNPGFGFEVWEAKVPLESRLDKI